MSQIEQLLQHNKWLRLQKKRQEEELARQRTKNMMVQEARRIMSKKAWQRLCMLKTVRPEAVINDILIKLINEHGRLGSKEVITDAEFKEFLKAYNKKRNITIKR